MGVVNKAFMDVMLNDGELDRLLPTYRDTKPMIFSRMPPDDEHFAYPYIISLANQSGNPAGTYASKQYAGYDIQRRVRMYDSIHRDETDLDEIAEQVRSLYHENEFSIASQWRAVDVQADWPQNSPTADDKYRGRRLTIAFSITEV